MKLSAIIVIVVVITLTLAGLAALASVPTRYVALEFSDYSVRPLNADFTTQRACAAFIEAQRRDAELHRRGAGGRFYGCDSVAEMRSYLRRVFGNKVADVFQ